MYKMRSKRAKHSINPRFTKERELGGNYGISPGDRLFKSLGGTFNYYDAAQKALWDLELHARGLYYNGMLTRANAIPPITSVGKEKITGERSVRDWRGNYAKNYRYVKHQRSRHANYPYYAAYTTNVLQNYGQYWPFGRRVVTYPSYPVITSGEIDRWGADVDRGFSSRAWYTMQPRFEGEVSLTNFIWELKDFKTYLRLLHDLDKIFYRSGSIINKAKAAVSRANPFSETSGGPITGRTKAVKDPTLIASELNLWWHFEVLPTLSDISTIFAQLLHAADEEQRKHAAIGEQGITRHYTEEKQIYVDHYLPRIGTKQSYNIWTTEQVLTVKRVATSQMHYDYKLRKGLDLFAKYWGLGADIETGWNMIPLSFLLDYVLTVGKTLHMMRIDKNTSVSQGLYGESIKLCKTDGLHLVCAPFVINSIVNGSFKGRRKDNHRRFVAGAETLYYTRRLADPIKYGLVYPRWKIPSAQQGLNVLSLARCLFT